MRLLLGFCLTISACDSADPCEPTPHCADDADCATHEVCTFQRVGCECAAYHGECGQARCETQHDWREDVRPPRPIGDEALVLHAEVANPQVLACGAVMVRLHHPRPNDVALRLRGPRGEELVFRGAHRRVALPDAWEGQAFDGTWTLEVRDEGEAGGGVFDGWTLRLYDPDADPVGCLVVDDALGF